MADELSVNLADFVGPLKAESDIAYATACEAEAAQLVEDYIKGYTVPEVVKVRAIREVGAELYHRRNAKNGVMQLASPDQPATRVARDPMVAAYPILNRYVPGGVA